MVLPRPEPTTSSEDAAPALIARLAQSLPERVVVLHRGDLAALRPGELQVLSREDAGTLPGEKVVRRLRGWAQELRLHSPGLDADGPSPGAATARTD